MIMDAQKGTVWYLKQINLFSDLSEEDLNIVSKCFVNKPYKKNAELAVSTKDGTLFVVKEGLVELYAISRDGKKIIVDLLGSGSIFGNLMASDEFDFNVKVRKPSIICSTSIDDFFSLVSKYPDAAEKLLRTLYRDITKQQERITSLASETVVQRLLRLLGIMSLREMVQKHKVRVTHEELAQMVGTSRQTVTSLLSSLEKKGRVRKVDGQYQLVD